MNFPSSNASWQYPPQFSQLPEDDFLALIQKQFSSQDAHRGRRPSRTTSDDSRPSTPDASRRQSLHAYQNDLEDQPLKRKASSDDLDPGPSSKNQHTDSTKMSVALRRRQSSNPHHDESRLLKRKEQNRAAQRAFRERKEKHVKDLEDKVAALEAKNDAAQTENSNLRDLLSRLQQENLELKQAQFTFSVPKPASAPSSTAQSSSSFGFFDTHSPFPPTPAPSQTPSEHPPYGTDIDWSSLTTFDPSMLSVLDEPSDVPMQTETTASPFGQYALPQSYKTIANNPLLMSFVDDSPFASSNTTSPPNSFDHFNFNFSAPNSWASAPPPSDGNGNLLHSNHGLEELFGGNYVGNQTSPAFTAPVSMSPIMHAIGDKASQRSPPANSVKSSPSTSASQSPFSRAMPSQPADSPPSGSESTSSGIKLPPCVSRSEIAKQIAEDGPSPFTELPNPMLRKTSDVSAGDMISCQGSNFPRTEERPENIEVLRAWRCLTQDPHFKDADINELCAEFSKKARCDGTKMVLEPESMHQLFEQFKELREQLSTQHPPPDPSSILRTVIGRQAAKDGNSGSFCVAPELRTVLANSV